MINGQRPTTLNGFFFFLKRERMRQNWRSWFILVDWPDCSISLKRAGIQFTTMNMHEHANWKHSHVIPPSESSLLPHSHDYTMLLSLTIHDSHHPRILDGIEYNPVCFNLRWTGIWRGDIYPPKSGNEFQAIEPIL